MAKKKVEAPVLEAVEPIKEGFIRTGTVKVKPIKRSRAGYPKGHDGEFKFTGCHLKLTLPYSNSRRSYKQVFDSNEEQAYFENVFNKKAGSLSIYDRNNDFWGKEFIVTLEKDNKELDLSVPSQLLEYKVLLANTDKIAPSWDERFKKGSYQYAIISNDREVDDTMKLSAKKERAMELFFEVKKSDKKMFDILRLLGKSPARNTIDNTQWLKSQLTSTMSQIEKVRNVSNIDDFIKVVEDAKFSEKVFVLDALDLGEITRDGTVYRLRDTNAPLGRSVDQAVEWFADPRNNEDKLLIEQRMEMNR